jgi:hypothetical protein
MSKLLPLRNTPAGQIVILLSVLTWCLSVAQAQGSDVVPGPFLGLTVPVDRAEVFAPGIVSTSGTEIMYGVLNGGRKLIFERTPPDFKQGDTWGSTYTEFMAYSTEQIRLRFICIHD